MSFDLAVIGAGIMGVTAALRAADGGMRVVIIERHFVAGEASGVNAGTLSLQIKRAALIPYALRGREWWLRSGDAMDYRETGGYTIAFDDRECALLETRMKPKIALGAPIRFVSAAAARAAEPALGPRVAGASHCPLDGFVDSTRTGPYLKRRLHEAGVEVRERAAVIGVEVAREGFAVRTPGPTVRARNLLLACGAWTKEVAAMLGVDLPVAVHFNTVSVIERAAPLLHSDLGHASGLLTLKQRPNGTFLVGGGWQGRATPPRGEVAPDTLAQNLRLAQTAVPALAGLRVVRAWTGAEGFVADELPLAGPLPGVADAYVIACVRGGYAVGPGIAPLVADRILGNEPALPLFDPSRIVVGA